MLLSLVSVALLGATPCHLSLLAPAAAPARLQAAAPTPLPLQPGDCAEPGSEAPRPAWQRRSLGFLGGAVGSALGALGGGLLGNLAGDGCKGACSELYVKPGVLFGVLAGIPLGAALGAHLTGSALEGRGRWWGSVLGAVGGTVAALLASSLLLSLDDDKVAPLGILPLLMPAAGAITGYELSAGPRPFAPCGGADGALAPRAPMLRLRVSF